MLDRASSRALVVAMWSTVVAAILPSNIPISYLDGSEDNQCRSKIETIQSGYGGLIYSHQPFGQPYSPERNCFLMLQAPEGYRIRLTVLEFDVNGDGSGGVCQTDSLHLFDQEDQSNTEGPGPIRGQYCGRLKNGTELVESTLNILTLWWHTDKQLQQSAHRRARGFRLLWTAFRQPYNGHCNAASEFFCQSGECIVAQMACDQLPHCKDRSDLQQQLQRRHGCENIPEQDMLTGLQGLALAGVCVGIVVGSVFICISLLICYRGLCRKQSAPQQSQAPLMVNGCHDGSLKSGDARMLRV